MKVRTALVGYQGKEGYKAEHDDQKWLLYQTGAGSILYEYTLQRCELGQKMTSSLSASPKRSFVFLASPASASA